MKEKQINNLQTRTPSLFDYLDYQTPIHCISKIKYLLVSSKIINIMIRTLLLGILLISTTSIITSSYFKKQGIHIKDTITNYKQPLQITTTCNTVNLNSSPYDYNGTVRSGYLNVGITKGQSALAFIFYGRQHTTETNLKNFPTIIWLNGGPGSSSQLGNLIQLGPFWIVETPNQNKTYGIIRNNHTWVKDYNVIFVDQPVGTGLSYADQTLIDPYTHSQQNVAQDFYNALINLYQNSNGCFKQLGITPDKDLFVIGESYAGKYVPAIASYIKSKALNGGPITGLRGIAIGDGFTQPYDILAQVGTFAYNIGLLDYNQRAKVQMLIINSTFQLNNKEWNNMHQTFDTVLDNIVEWSGGVNVYDFTKYKPYHSYLLDDFFNDPSNIQLYKLNPGIPFDRHSAPVYKAMYEDFMKPVPESVEYLLDQNVSVLIYNGQNDIIVETPGTCRWVQKLYYHDSEQFQKTTFKTWKVNGKVAGSYKKAGRLQLKIVNNAGHMVPMDQGENCLSMIREFINALRISSVDNDL